MSKQKQIILVAVLAFVALGGIFMLLTKAPSPQSPPVTLPTTEMADAVAEAGQTTEMAAAEETVPETFPEAAPESPPVPESASAGSSASIITDSAAVTIDVAAALAERTLGAPDAKVKVVEYASLSCGHCASFHKDVLPQLKAAYIDTGKIQFTFNDYPLNAPAMDGAMIARCLPQEKYFNFIKFLFDTQEEWAYTADYKKHLRQNAKLLGGSDALVDACLGNDDLKTGLIERMQKAATDHDIKSTPSFVVNGVVLRGANDFNAMSVIINKALEESATAQ